MTRSSPGENERAVSDDLAALDVALRGVATLASRLRVGSAEGHVRRSVDELGAALTGKTGVEPAVERLLRSLESLADQRSAGLRRDFQRGAPSVSRLMAAINLDLLPALRRLGYSV